MKKYLYYNLFALVIFVAFLLRIYKIDFSGFSLDEMISLNLAENFSFLNLISDNHPPIHALATKLWINIFGLTEALARFPSVIFSLGATITIGITALKFGNMRLSLICMFLHALFPLSILHAQQVRPNALFELTSSIQFFYYLSYLQDKTKFKSLLFASLLVALSSYLAGLLFIFEYAFQQRKKNGFILILAINILIVVAFIFSRELVSWHHLDWQLIKYNLETLAFLPIELIKAFNYYSIISGLGLAIFFVQFVRGLDSDQLNQFYKTTAITLSFVISLITFSLVTKRAVFSERYFVFLIPIFFYSLGMFIKHHLDDKKNSGLLICAFSLIVVGSFFGIQNKIPQSNPPWKDAAMSIGTYPSSLVLTTSTLALSMPYFKYRNIGVEPMSSEEALANQLNILLNTFQNVWIVDTYWNKLINFPNLNTIAIQSRLKVEDLTIYDENSASVVVYRVSR